MTFKKLFLLISMLLSLFAGAVSAQTITFQFSGQVTYGGPMGVPPGTVVTGTFTYDADTAPAATMKNYASYQILLPSAISMNFNGRRVVSDFLSVTLMNNTKSNVGDLVDVTGVSPVLDGTSFVDGAFGFRIASAANQNNAIKNTKLPHKFKLEKFNAGPSMNVGFLQMNGGPNGMLLEFSIDSLDVISHTKK